MKYQPIPLLVLEVVHFRPAFEHPRLARRFLEYVARCFFVVLLELHQLVGTHAHDHPADVVETTEPQLSGVVTGVDRHLAKILVSNVGKSTTYRSGARLGGEVGNIPDLQCSDIQVSDAFDHISRISTAHHRSV